MVGKFIQILILMGLGIFGYFMMNQQIASMDTTQLSSAAQAMISIVPILFVAMVIGVIIMSLGKDSEAEKQIDWTKYGERLKLAYAAKFGGENPGFNNEVDYRIKILVNTDKGFTRQLAKDWVKRMSDFVDIQYLKMDNANNEP
jgi:hypothetical protein